MDKRLVMKSVLALAVLTVTSISEGKSQHTASAEGVTFTERNLSGPRMGFTYAYDDGKFANALQRMDMNRMFSQFGWHFEYQVTPSGGGPSFLVEIIPLVGGVESGRFMPSITAAFGVRLPEGYEIGVGPNASKISLTGGDFNTSLVIAVGKSFDYGGVSIPINLAYATSPLGGRLSLVFGYAIQHSSK